MERGVKNKEVKNGRKGSKKGVKGRQKENNKVLNVTSDALQLRRMKKMQLLKQTLNRDFLPGQRKNSLK